MSELVRPELLSLAPVVHGSVALEELRHYGLSGADVVDFSVNTNPLGPARCVLEALADTNWSRYPGDDEAPLRRQLAGLNHVSEHQVVLGNGSVDLMWWTLLAVIRPGDGVAVAEQTFGEYARAARSVGAHVVDLQQAAAARVVFVCQPNNPTGEYSPRDDIEALLSQNPERLVVLDEAYAAFVDHRWPAERLLDQHPNLAILRSMTKDHALPGLRLGYLLASAEVARAVGAVRPPWSVNAGALRAGLAALQPEAQHHVERARAVVVESRAYLTDGLRRLGFRVKPSAANFILVEVSSGDAAAFRRALLPLGMVVRDCASFGLPSCVRIACRLPSECERLLAAIEEVAGVDVVAH
ncbi:MAG TPA: histidinol-phosphate transaminase [Chloroflexota bacterium]|jgi:histidinol-phosphate aminotransferase